MTTVSDTRYDIWVHLDATEYHALKRGCWTDTDVTLGRALIPELVKVIRVLVPESDESPIMEKLHRLVKDPERHMVKAVERYDWD